MQQRKLCIGGTIGATTSKATPKPVLKWAGGKTQLLPELTKLVPKKYGKYIEPFFGGGALFFNLQPSVGVIAELNPELVCLYKAIRDHVEEVIDNLRTHYNDEDHFYQVRSQDWTQLSEQAAAARTIFLNRTCFNGLYRVNRKGQFNVPFGHYNNPRIVDETNLRSVSASLSGIDIVLGDYKTVLKDTAEPGDFIFLDPPYLPVSEYSDFKRYTKERFYEEDHVDLAAEVGRLHELGCHVVLTNSNHPLVHELYRRFEINVVSTRRSISARSDRRRGEDVIVRIPPKVRLSLSTAANPIDSQTQKFPTTRYMGSKNKLLQEIWALSSQFEYDTVLDLFSGSGIVSYMFKSKGKKVISNDYLAFSANLTKALVENSSQTLSPALAEYLVSTRFPNDRFVTDTFAGLYYSDTDNAFVDSIRYGIQTIRNPYQRSIAMAALVRACIKKRPRGIFTYTGMRYDDGRRDLQLSFEEHFLTAVDLINAAVFDNHRQSRSRHGDAMTASAVPNSLVYIDPPYYSLHSDNEYVRRYHFVEGLARGWKGVQIQEHTQTKKFKNYPTPFSSRLGAHDAFDKLFRRHRNAVILVSYSSNSLPTLDEMVSLLGRYKHHVEVVPIPHRYSFGNQSHKASNNNEVLEYLFVGY